MEEKFLTFQKFNDEGIAKNLTDLLAKNDIKFETEDSNKFFDVSFANNPLGREIRVKLQPKDFEVTKKLLEIYYKKQTENVDKDYYLFEFTDQELTEIVMKPDEWGDFDYQLAQQLLKERGIEIKPAVIELITKQRNDDLAKPIEANKYLFTVGYVFAILGGLIGILIGAVIAYSKKTLPDGRSVYRYTEDEKDKGIIIMFLGVICSAIWFFINRYLLLY